jgi:diguanylate cyclase (GGDEF)-like protein
MASDSARARHLPGDYARLVSAGVLISYVALVALALVFNTDILSAQTLGGTALFLATLLAATFCLRAWQILPAEVNLPWMLFGTAAMFAVFSHAGYLSGDAATRTSIIHVSWSLAYVFFLGGLVRLVHQSEGGRWTELGMDVLLVLAAATLVVLRWAPGLASSPAVSPASYVLLLVTPVSALCAALLTIALLAAPPATLPRASATALAGATLSLAVSALPRSPATLAPVGMWVLLMFAGATAAEGGGNRVVVPQGGRLRRFVAPTAAILLAAVAVDISFNSAVERSIAIAIGLSAVLLAVRLTQLLNATRSQVAERRELAQSRALIDVSRSLATTNDLDATLRTVTDSAQRVFNAKAAVIEMLSPDGQELVLRAATGLPPSVVGLTFPVKGSFTGWIVENGDMRVTAHADHDPFISQHIAAMLGKAPLAGVPLRYRERTLGVIACIGTRPFDAHDLELLRAFANHAAAAIENARLFEQVRALSVTDALTGLANRRHLDRELQREFSAARRGRRLVAVMFDLDDFKQHNDRYGHLAGDRALRHFAEALDACTRAMNLAARYGGDEFFALLADTDWAGAETFVERVTERFHEIMRAAGNPLLSVSAGIAEFRSDMESAAELVEAADRALYMTKSEGATSK